ncbi:MAG: cell wall hydrolase [Lachnospiraceae bacterium]
MEQNNRTFSLKYITLFVFILVLVGLFSLTIYASTTAEQLKEEQERADEMQSQIDENEEILEDLANQKAEYSTQLNSYNSQLSEASSELEQTETDIVSKLEEIDLKLEELEKAKTVEEKQYADMLVHIQFMYESDMEDYYIYSLFNMSSFSDFLNLSEYVDQVVAYDRMKLDEFEAIRVYVEEQEAALQVEREALEDLQAQQEIDKNFVSNLVSQTQTNITGTESEMTDTSNTLTSQEEELATINNNIAELQEKLAEELRLSEEAAAGVWRDISEVTFSDGDLEMLANIVYCEARGESYAGQLAVASVVINRVLSGSYPSTVSGVIYQSSQFAPVTSTTNSFIEALAQDKAANSSGCYQAAQEAMSGITNVDTCVYFQTIAYLEKVDRLSVVKYVIGNHGFY